MSRVSLNKRLLSVRAKLLPPGSVAERIHNLPPDLKRQHDLWRADLDADAAEAMAAGGPGELYRRMIMGEYRQRNPPASIAAIIFQPEPDTPIDPYERYSLMLEHSR